MTEPADRLDLAAAACEVTGLVSFSAAGFLVDLIVGLAVTGIALFCVGFFGLAKR